MINGYPVTKLINALVGVDYIGAKSILDATLLIHKPDQVVEKLLVPAFESIGKDWEEGRLALSQVYMSGRICEELFDSLQIFSSVPAKTSVKIAITVLEDFHALGKRIILSFLNAAGYRIIDYGLGLSVKKLVKLVEKDRIKLLLISVLMLPSAMAVRELRQALDKKGLKVKLLVGGAPFRFDPGLWQEVGADGVGMSAKDALVEVERLLAEVS